MLENKELANLVRFEMGDKTAEQIEAEHLEGHLSRGLLQLIGAGWFSHA